MKLPQLSLRDLFWLVALVAMGCGWWVDSPSDEFRAAERAIRKMQLKPGENGSLVVGGYNYELDIQVQRR